MIDVVLRDFYLLDNLALPHANTFVADTTITFTTTRYIDSQTQRDKMASIRGTFSAICTAIELCGDPSHTRTEYPAVGEVA